MDEQYADVAGQEKRRAPHLETSSERKELTQLVNEGRGSKSNLAKEEKNNEEVL